MFTTTAAAAYCHWLNCVLKKRPHTHTHTQTQIYIPSDDYCCYYTRHQLNRPCAIHAVLCYVCRHAYCAATAARQPTIIQYPEEKPKDSHCFRLLFISWLFNTLKLGDHSQYNSYKHSKYDRQQDYQRHRISTIIAEPNTDQYCEYHRKTMSTRWANHLGTHTKYHREWTHNDYT